MEQNNTDELTYLEIKKGMSNEEIANVLRNNAIIAHQNSVGQGNKLIQLLERALKHMETTHKWLQDMNVILFFVGIVVIVAGILLVYKGNGNSSNGSNVIPGLIFGVGGSGISLATIFINAPMKRISSGIADLIQLETAFLGFIRAIGEIDSAFQWRYIETLYGESKGRLDVNIEDTKTFMVDMVTKTMALIDQYVGSVKISNESQEELKRLIQRMDEFEKKLNTNR